MSVEANNLIAETTSVELTIQTLQAEKDAVQEQLHQALKKIEWFEEQLKLGKYRYFGKQSETSHSMNLSLFDDNESDEVEENIERVVTNTEQVVYSRAAKKGSARKTNTSLLPRERVIHDLSAEEKICACGCEMHQIGEDVSEKIDYVPAQLKVVEHVTPKYACRACETIKSAKKSKSVLQKSMATVNLIVDVILKKYDEHLPLYRQSKIWEREGILIPDNTLGNWVMAAAEALWVLREAFFEQISVSKYLQADETRVKVLESNKTGFMWVYQGLDAGNRFVFFEFDSTRASYVPEKRLEHFCGLLQTDGYSGYKNIGAREAVVHLGCWDHARRKFTDAIKVSGNNSAGTAGVCLSLINKLYHIERTLKEVPDSVRYEQRQEQSLPILNKLFDKIGQVNALPKSTLGTAITYLKNNQPQLRRYVDYGHSHISNCLTENAIRPFALGRRNWLFVGNEDCANKSALLYSLIQTCKINHINPRQYLSAVLNLAPALRRAEVDPKSLLPQFIDLQNLSILP